MRANKPGPYRHFFRNLSPRFRIDHRSERPLAPTNGNLFPAVQDTRLHLQHTNSVADLETALTTIFASLHLPFGYQSADLFQFLKTRIADIERHCLYFFSTEHPQAGVLNRLPADEQILLRILALLWALSSKGNLGQVVAKLEFEKINHEDCLQALSHVVLERISKLRQDLSGVTQVQRTTGYPYTPSIRERLFNRGKTAEQMFQGANRILDEECEMYRQVRFSPHGRQTYPPVSAQAISLFEHAASLGHIEAMAELGRIFVTGRCSKYRGSFEGPQDKAKGLLLLKLAADAGHDVSFLLWMEHKTHRLSDTEVDPCLERVRRLARSGHELAQKRMYGFFESYKRLTLENRIECTFWTWLTSGERNSSYHKFSTSLEDLEAIYAFGQNFLHSGSSRDVSLKTDLEKLIAYKRAKRDYGKHPGFSRRDEAAFYFQACFEARAFPLAIEEFGEGKNLRFPKFLESDLDIIEDVLQERKTVDELAFLERARKHERPYMLLLARLYENGAGVTENFKEANTWYELYFRESQDPRAAEGLMRLFFFGGLHFVQNFAEALKWFCFVPNPTPAAQAYKKHILDALNREDAMEFARRNAQLQAQAWNMNLPS